MRPAAALLSVAYALTAAAAFAFDAQSDGPGSHLEATRTALAAVYRVPLGKMELAGTMPVYGIADFAWDVYRPADLLADASRDIDFYFYGPDYAHAQSPGFDPGRAWTAAELQAVEAAALYDYLKFFASWLDHARLLLADPERRADGAYLLGVLFHSYEDLWAHRGITNEMHKALAKYRGLDVDRAPDRVLELRERLAAWLADLPALLGDQAGPAFLAFLRSPGAVARPGRADRNRLLGRGRDIFWQAVAIDVFGAAPEASLRWRAAIEWDTDSLDRLLRDGAGLAAAAALPTPEALAGFLIARGYRF
jgi:hypothetical protein